MNSMIKFCNYSVFLVSALVFVSMGIAQASEKRVEAEQMKLTNYQIESSGSTAFIKLTSSTGIAKFNFIFPSGRYDIDARYLAEKIGRNTYALYLNGVQIISWIGKNRDEQWHFLSEQKWHSPKNIAFKKGDEIRIETLSGTGSLAILDYIEFTESNKTNSKTKQSQVIIYPEEYDHAIRNPLMGFRSSLEKEHEYGTLVKTHFRWNELESSASDGVDKITSDQFKKWVIVLSEKPSQAWDNDSLVANVEMHLIGHWGAMELPEIIDDIQSDRSLSYDGVVK